MPTPNLFDYATKELSQDAFICWLVACARDADGSLRECGRDFISALMKRGQKQYGRRYVVTEVSSPETQYKGIDVYFQARVDGRMVSFVIEDKIDTIMHSGQLDRYREIVKSDRQPEDEFRLIYYKTGYVYDNERDEAAQAGYTVFGAEDMQRFLNQNRQPAHEILRQYRDRIGRIIAARNESMSNWDWRHGFVQHGFMKGIRDALIDQKGHWTGAFAPDDRRPDFTDKVTRGTNRGGGGPWTQYWFCGSLFWRLDAFQPLRLRLWTENVIKFYPEWTTDTWHQWIDTFRRLQGEHGLPARRFRKRMRKGENLVQEGTVGAIDLGDDPEQLVPRIVRLHIAFLNEVTT